MKSFKEFLSESVTINGDFNGTLNIGNESKQSQPVGEEFVADIVWEGKIYRLEIEGRIPSKNELAEQLQGEYPGAIVHNIYPVTSGSLNIKSSQRYRPERLSWSD